MHVRHFRQRTPREVANRGPPRSLNGCGPAAKLAYSRPVFAVGRGCRVRPAENPGSWRNWQTRKVEGLVPARACWFNSSRAQLIEKALRPPEGLFLFLRADDCCGAA